MKNEIVILIIGCFIGIGWELCKILFDRGYIVVVIVRNVENLKDLFVLLKLLLDVIKKEFILYVINEVILRF